MKTKNEVQDQNSNKPLMLFFLISFTLAWLVGGVAIAVNYGLLEGNVPVMPLLIIGSWAPNIAAFMVLGLIMKKKGGIKELLKGWTKWKVSISWYLVAISPVIVAFLGIGLYRLFNGYYPIAEEVSDLGFLVAALLAGVITGATGEELGWRGFALPWLQSKMSALLSSVVLGFIISLWHLPLWFAGLGFETMSFPAFTLVCISFAVVTTWALNNTKGSLFIASLFHLFLNFSLVLFTDEVFPCFAGVFALYAIGVIVIYGPQKLIRTSANIPINKSDRTWLTK